MSNSNYMTSRSQRQLNYSNNVKRGNDLHISTLYVTYTTAYSILLGTHSSVRIFQTIAKYVFH
jgi:hypothetical protein